jgi:hypothetical protein
VSVGSLSGSFKVRSLPAPATFKVGPLVISRSEIAFGEETVISVLVENTGDVAGLYTVTFKINGATAGVRDANVAAHATQKVEYAAFGKAPGTFSVDVNGQAGSFTVKPLPAPPGQREVNWWIIGAIVAAVVTGAMFATGTIKRRAI